MPVLCTKWASAGIAAEIRFRPVEQSSIVFHMNPAVVKGKGLSWKASELEGFTLRGTATLGDPPTAASWSDLVEGVDYETDGENITVLYTSAYNFIAIVAK